MVSEPKSKSRLLVEGVLCQFWHGVSKVSVPKSKTTLLTHRRCHTVFGISFFGKCTKRSKTRLFTEDVLQFCIGFYSTCCSQKMSVVTAPKYKTMLLPENVLQFWCRFLW
jgi:hypothetical protein